MSLRLKMVLGIGGILFLVVLGYTIIALDRQAMHLRNMARREADLIAAVAGRAISRAMADGKSEEAQRILERIGEDPDLLSIRIVDGQGRILRSAERGEIGRLLPPGERPPRGEAPEPNWDARAQTVSVYRPIPNAPGCTGCHPGAGANLGFLQARVSFPAIDSELAQQWAFMLLLAILSLAVAGSLIGIFFTVAVGRRIEHLSSTMSRVEAGDLSARVSARGPDELSRLGESFNAMVARLADARRRLEDQHAQEIRRAEHLASLGQMAAGIAHEINNPIAGMLNCVRSLARGMKDEEQRVQYLTMLQDGLGRIGHIVGQLLSFAREEKPQVKSTAIRPILDKCLGFLEHEMHRRRVTCAIEREDGLPRVLGDAYLLEQVFLNILKNAVDAMPNGGAITVTSRVQEVERSRCLRVEIRDTGVGILPEHLSRIFDPFFTTKEVGNGTGLGLSVSYGIVRAHGGFLEVQSEVGKGSTFSVVLPVGEA